mmetsp:Transcript_2985/g.4502  ORF Transcript_2985/g.4502 Transcript_2985/m.4502 type:complete len:110 (+) Transcript_2985:322-651(+)
MPYRRRRQLWISRSNEASANSRREQQVRWAITLDWPGLEYQVYPVKITRSVTVASLEEQFDGCIIRCPASMDSVLNCLKLKQLSSSFDYKFFSDDICQKVFVAREVRKV